MCISLTPAPSRLSPLNVTNEHVKVRDRVLLKDRDLIIRLYDDSLLTLPPHQPCNTELQLKERLDRVSETEFYGSPKTRAREEC